MFIRTGAARLLGQFVSYLEVRGTSTVTTSNALAWATLPAGASPTWQAIRLSVVRGFAAYLRSARRSAWTAGTWMPAAACSSCVTRNSAVAAGPAAPHCHGRLDPVCSAEG